MSHLYIHEKSPLNDFKPDQTTIIEKKYLKYISRVKFTKKKCPSRPIDWYPFVNTYYPYIDFVDTQSQANYLMYLKRFDKQFKEMPFNEHSKRNQDYYSTTDIQIQYLNSHPVSFIIFGKPNIGEIEVGKLLSDHWKTVYIDPESLIKEEIASNSRTGYCMEFNLRCGRAIDSPVILHLLQRKIDSDLVKHRGMVLCGFPLVPNNLYEEDPVSSESAIFTSKEICEDLFDLSIPEAIKHVSKSDIRDEIILEKPQVCPISTFEVWTVENQLENIFKQFHEPFIIIYLICDNCEVLAKRRKNRYNVYTNEYINLQRKEEEKVVHTIFRRESKNPPNISEEMFVFFQSSFDTSEHFVRKPYDFHISIVPQVELYNFYFLPTIEKYIINHNPENFIRLDGRLSPQRMFNAIRIKLRTLNIQKPLIPEKLLEKNESTEADVEIIPSTQNLQDVFTLLSMKKTPHVYFKWTWSDWGQLCPVSMITGKNQEGDPNYAVQFMNRIFFLSNEDSYKKFITNPRPYLLPPYPKSSCRIFIFGPKYTGKSSVARCLSYLLQGIVLNYDELYDKFMEVFIKEEKDRIRAQAILEGIQVLDQMRLDEWNQLENERNEKISNWLSKFLDLIKRRISFIKPSHFLDEFSSFPPRLSMAQSQLIIIKNLQNEFNEFNIDLFTNEAECLAIEANNNKAMDYLPEELKIIPTLEPASAFDDFVQEFANNAVDNININELIMSYERINKELLETINQIEIENESRGGIRGGWIVEGMPLIKEIIDVIIPKLCPGEIYLLIDQSPHQFIIDRFREHLLQEYIDYKTFFLNLNKPEAAILGSIVENESLIVVQDLLGDLLDDVTNDIEYENDEEVQLYKTDINSFVLQWASNLSLFHSLKINIVEFDVTNKSLEELLIEVVRRTDNLYKKKADRLPDFQLDAEVSGEGDEEEELKPNRRFGDTLDYCPIALYQGSLWKGKKEFAATFNDSIYLMSSENALKQFLNDPRQYLLIKRSLPNVPPPRICIIGPTGTGKTTLSKRIAINFGLHYISFNEFIKNLITPGNSLQLKDILELKSANELGVAIEDWFSIGTQIPEHLLDQLFENCWKQNVIKHFGFVLDGFPFRPSDVEWMTNKMAIPDIVVELSINLIELRNRLIDRLIRESDERFHQCELRNKERIRLWEVKRAERFKQLVEMRKEERYLTKIDETILKPIQEIDEELEVNVSKTMSQITYDSVDQEQDLTEIQQILNEEIPPPLLEEPIEITEQFLESYELTIDDEYNRDLEFLRTTRQICEQENIPWLTVDGALPPEKLFAQTTILLKKYKLRTKSHLESVYDLPVELAESLLLSGYYFLSKFGRTCPVQVYDKTNSIQMFLPGEENNCLYPMLHRQYIYFIVGKENQSKFKKDPLTYVKNNKIRFPLVPVKMAIIGQPKSGKSTLAQRFRKSFGLKVITRGQSIRYVLEYLKSTILAKEIEAILRLGETVPSDLVIKCVEAFTFDGRCLTQGIVYDGFPENYLELTDLLSFALLPNFLIDLRIDPVDLIKFVKSVPRMNNLPPYSLGFIQGRTLEWLQSIDCFNEYVDREFQNKFTIKVSRCKWGVWNEAVKLFEKMKEFKKYYMKCFDGKVLSLTYMLVNPMEFNQRKGVFKQYCPCCWYFKQQFNNGGNPPNRQGLVQFLMCFYYICPEHYQLFKTKPRKFLPPFCPSVLPTSLPTRVKLIPETNCYEDGYCIICFWDNQPYLVLKNGKYEYTVKYKGKFYLFDHLSCMNKFMLDPESYYNKRINFKGKKCKPLVYRELPILGILEQYQARNLVKAVTNTGILRPIIPGLTIEISAAINIALHLKIHNRKTSENYRKMYIEQQNYFHEQRKGLISMLEIMKRVQNPYIYYEEPLMQDPEFYKILWASRAVSRVSEKSSTKELLEEIASEILENDCQSN